MRKLTCHYPVSPFFAPRTARFVRWGTATPKFGGARQMLRKSLGYGQW